MFAWLKVLQKFCSVGSRHRIFTSRMQSSIVSTCYVENLAARGLAGRGMDNLLLFILCGVNQAYRRVPWSSVVHLGGRRVLLSLGGTTSLSNDCTVSINDSDRVTARSRRSRIVGFHKYPPIVRMLNRLCNKGVTYPNCVFLSSWYSGFLNKKTDFTIISPPWYDCCWGDKPQ